MFTFRKDADQTRKLSNILSISVYHTIKTIQVTFNGLPINKIEKNILAYSDLLRFLEKDNTLMSGVGSAPYYMPFWEILFSLLKTNHVRLK